jgi:hypothetical protein
MPSKYTRLTDYLEYLENSVYSRDEVDSRDFLNFEPKVGMGNNNIVSYNTSGLTFSVSETRIFLGGYSHTLPVLPLTLPTNTLCYVFLEKGSGRDDIIIDYTTTELQNSFNKIYIAKVQTGSSSITSVEAYSVTPFGSFASYEKIATFETSVTIGANSSYSLNLSSLGNINTQNKTFLDMSIQYSVYNSGSMEYEYPYPNIVQKLNSGATTLTIENNNGSSVDITITIFG